MLLWFAGGALVAAWLVFRDPAFDHRLLIVGALAPDVLDLPFGGARFFHTLLAGVATLAVVMLATRGRRVLRRHLLALPIGLLLHLVLDGMWARTEVFWWPAFGTSFEDTPLPVTDRWALVPVLEVAGAAALVWGWRFFGLDDPQRRRTFLRTGRFDRRWLEGRGPAGEVPTC